MKILALEIVFFYFAKNLPILADHFEINNLSFIVIFKTE